MYKPLEEIEGGAEIEPRILPEASPGAVENIGGTVHSAEPDRTCCRKCLHGATLIGGLLHVTITDCAVAALLMTAILPLLGGYWIVGKHGYFGVKRIGFLIASICHTRLALVRLFYEQSGSKGLVFLLLGIVAFASSMGSMVKFCQVCDIQWGHGLLIKMAVVYGLCVLPSNMYKAYVEKTSAHKQEGEPAAGLNQQALPSAPSIEGVRWGHLVVAAIVTSAIGAIVVIALDYIFYEVPRFTNRSTVVEQQVFVSIGSQIAMHSMLKLVLTSYSTTQRVDFFLNAYVAVEVLAKISLYRVPCLYTVAIISTGQMAIELGFRSIHALEPLMRAANKFWMWSVLRALGWHSSDDDMPPRRLSAEIMSEAKKHAAIEARLMSIGEFCAHFSAICTLVLWPTGVDSIFTIGAKLAIGMTFEVAADLCAGAIGISLGVDARPVALKEDVWHAYKSNTFDWCANLWTTVATITCPIACMLATIWAKEWGQYQYEWDHYERI